MLNQSNFVDDSAGLDMSVDSGAHSRRLLDEAIQPRPGAANLDLSSEPATHDNSKIALHFPAHPRDTRRCSPLPAHSSGLDGEEWWVQSNAFQGVG